MFNPMQILQFMQQGINPQQMFNKLASENPQIKQMMNGVNFNDINSVENLCKNICMQKGVDFETMKAQFRQFGGKL